jgi:MFS family permease
MAESTDEVSSPELNPEPVVNPGATTEATPTDQAGQRAAYRAVLQNPNVRTLAASKAFNKMAIAALTYGAMVHLAGIGAPQFQISSVSASSTVAAVLFGFQGGTAADTMPKRIAIAGGHGLLAITCFLVPSLFGTGVGQLMLLIFLTSLIMQVVGPGLSAAVALVANPRDLATASAIVSIGGYAAAGVGSALIAPTLIKLTGIDVVIYVAGALYALGAIRALKLPQEEQPSSARSLRDVDWKPQALSLRRTSGLIVQYRAIATMI